MKNKLAVSTLAFENWKFADAVSVCKKYGIGAIELRMGFHDWSRTELSDEFYAGMYEYLQAQGLEISDLATGVKMNGCKKEALDELERCAQIARILHCRGLRIMFGYKRQFHSQPAPDVLNQRLVQWLKEADERMEPYGTEIWIEAHDELSTGKILRQLLDQYPFRNVRLLWDIMHSLEEGEEPEDTLAYMGKDLVHIHIKDGVPRQDPDARSWKYTRIGEGIVPIKKIVEQLLAQGYDGYYSLEWESPWREELRGEGFEVTEMIGQYSRMMEEIV